MSADHLRIYQGCILAVWQGSSYILGEPMNEGLADLLGQFVYGGEFDWPAKLQTLFISIVELLEWPIKGIPILDQL